MKLHRLLVVCALTLPLAAALEEKATIRKTFPVSQPGAAKVEVDNLNGSIRVTGYDGREVQVVAYERVEADSKEKLAEARRDVRLDASEQGNTVRLFVDGPFRCKCPDRRIDYYRGRGYFGYEVRYDFEIRAPKEAAVLLRTVNDGEIRVENIEGGYNIDNINGGVEMKDAAGSGRVYALNGGVKITFLRNPRADSYFGSLNGPVDLFFQPGLSANLRMKTFNGQIYSDFAVTPLATNLVAAEQRNGKRFYQADRFTNARVGAGGPEIKLDGFNGDIRILKRQ